MRENIGIVTHINRVYFEGRILYMRYLNFLCFFCFLFFVVFLFSFFFFFFFFVVGGVSVVG